MAEQNLSLDEFPVLETSRPRTSETPVPEQIASVNKLDGLPARLEMEKIELPIVSGPATELGPQGGQQAERSQLMRQAETPERVQRALESPARLATTRPDEADYSELIPQRVMKPAQPEELPPAEGLTPLETVETITRNPASNQLEVSTPDLAKAQESQDSGSVSLDVNGLPLVPIVEQEPKCPIQARFPNAQADFCQNLKETPLAWWRLRCLL